MVIEERVLPPLETERLKLLPPQLVKPEMLLHYLTANRVFHEPWEPIRSEDYYTITSAETILCAQGVQTDSGSALHYYITRSGNDEIIGKISCTQIVPYPFHSTFVGYSLSHHHIHRGYMGEALRAVIAYGCRALNLHRFEANIMPGNRSSINVALSAGFVYEGFSPDYLMIKGEWEGHEHYVYINREWQDKPPEK